MQQRHYPITFGESMAERRFLRPCKVLGAERNMGIRNSVRSCPGHQQRTLRFVMASKVESHVQRE